jgi:hypothetical protein
VFPLKQSTAIDVSFFAHDVNGDGVTGLADGGFTKRIRKNGAAFGAMTVTVAELENGWYELPLSSAHTDTLGELVISLSHASCKRVNLVYRVHASLPDDHATAAALATVQADTDNIQTRLPAALVGGRMASNAEVVGDKTGYALTSGEEDAIVDKVWDELKSAHTTADSFGDYLDDEITSRATAADVPSAAAIADAVLDEDMTAHQTQGSLGQAIGDPVADADTIWGLVNANLNATVSSRASQASVDVIDDLVDDLESRLTAGRATNLDNLDAAVTTRATPAQVNAEVVDALNVDTYAEVGQETPASTQTIRKMLGLLYKAWRNRVTTTGTAYSLYGDDASTVDQKATLSDNGTTFERTEIVTGP